MASFFPLSQIIFQYDKVELANHWIKAYNAGTTTPRSLYTDATGSVAAAKFELDTEGFPITSGNSRITPYISNGVFDLWLFPTEADADNNDTTNAIQLADNANPKALQSDGPTEFETLTALGAGSGFVVNEIYSVQGFDSAGDSDPARWKCTSITKTGGSAGFDSNGVYRVDNGDGTFSEFDNINSVVSPEFFGAVGDYDFLTRSGTINTAALMAMFRSCARKGKIINLEPGSKYLTDTLRLSSFLDSTYPSKSGRIRIEGAAMGIATGNIEPQGSGFAHVDGSADKLFDFTGNFSVSNPSQQGRAISFNNVILIGGDQTTDVVYVENANGQINFSNYIVRVRNGSGNGITEVTTWETTHNNGLIRGDADPDDPLLNTVWTGVGLDIKCDDSQGQNNMKVYQNVNVYRCGVNIRVGRRSETSGTFAPLLFLSGQSSLSQHEGVWVDGGVYNLKSIGQQIEGSRLNGLRIDSDGANDLPRNIGFDALYLTNNGSINDGSDSSYAINIQDGDGVSITRPIFQNAGDGILIDIAAGARSVKIENPTLRTVNSYGATSGTFIKVVNASGGQVSGCEIIGDLIVNNSTNTLIDDPAEVLQSNKNGGRLSVGSGSTPSISRGGGLFGGARIVNLNYAAPTTIDNFLGAKEYDEIIVTFSNTNPTISDNANIFLNNGVDFVPTSSRSTLTLIFQSGAWQETGRSQP